MAVIFSRLSLFRKASVLAATATAASATTFLVHQKRAQIKGTCEFSEHTRKQHQEHLISGMHSPFITQNKQLLDQFHEHFGQFSHLLPKSAEQLQQQQALKTSVKISPLKECPIRVNASDSASTLLAVGGPPALITATASIGKGKKIVYLNDERRWPIANGSAWHIEEDADAEAPTTYSPLTFMKNQILRAAINRESYEQIEKTGMFPWRTLDWIGNIKHPEQWLPAFKVALNFQMKNMKHPSVRQAEVEKVIERCRFNETFYHQLNEKVGGKLLLPGSGGIIVARNQAEIDDLYAQQKNLAKEGRAFHILSRDDLIKRFGFSLEGIAFAEKPHDKVLSPAYKQILSDYIKQEGGTVIDGTLMTVYTDAQNSGGIAKYRTPNGQEHYLPFGQLTMSLGNQEIRDFNNKPLFDIIGATGSSGLALVYTPTNYKLPRVSVFGGTNHVPLLSNEPVPVKYEGKDMHLNLIRFTAGACITPAYRGKEGGDHDSTISLGLVNTIYKTLGSDCKVKILTVYGCNRMVSKNGQTDWIQPYPGIYVQYGPGGGGLTRAPDLVASFAATQTNAKPGL